MRSICPPLTGVIAGHSASKDALERAFVLATPIFEAQRKMIGVAGTSPAMAQEGGST
jgi:hypothetical protein